MTDRATLEALRERPASDMGAPYILSRLEKRHAPPKWLTVREVYNSTGGRFERRVDLFAIAAWPSGGFETIAYEIKISRSDFQRDIRQPLKQRHGRLYANHFYFATTPGLIRPDELPDWAGLIEFGAGGDYAAYGDVVATAPDLPRIHPTWPFLAGLVRSAQQQAAKRPTDAA